ncbi:hypothetical protein HK18_08935 [Commensalibacter intestini]|uniref:DUF805 domain-containing protein n=1 Tax=Commensalibacter intestini TaxID=479936 RepID=A0A251ZU19_9PROT|nr:DUF805 domain-containing protein [Commensalibacter intestini]OUI78166.1 hypothetical protein HK18_08935 [Commensalibacter intestini]
MSEIIQKLLMFIKNMPKAWGEAWHHYFYFQGRTNNVDFWSFAIINSFIAFILFLINDAFGLVYRIQYENYYLECHLLFTIYILLSFIPSFCLCIRRLHDLNLRGIWFWVWLLCLLISLPYMYINFICQWILLVIASYPSGDKNRFGEKPQGESSI